MHGMMTYFIRRLLLVPVTFVCITFMVYTIMRLAPGGPIEQAQLQMQQAAMREGGGGSSVTATGDMSMPQEAIDQLKRYYKLDKPIPIAYLIWLGVWRDDPDPTPYKILDREYFVLSGSTVETLPGREVQERIDAAFLPRPLHLVDSLPRNPTGKIPREALLELASQLSKRRDLP